jgi:hypothetical protein
MRRCWAVLFLILVPVALVSPAAAKSARKAEHKLTAREQAALDEALFKLSAGLLQVGAGASSENLNLIETGTRDLARQRAAARREGIPLTPKEFQHPSPPPDQDAAPIYEHLTRLLKEKPLDAKLEMAASSLGSRYQYGPEEVAAARKLLADRADVTALVHQATARPQCVFQRDWALGDALEFPEYAPARAAARLLKAESYLLALDNRYPEAVANQTGGFRIAAHFASDGPLIGYMVAIACEAMTLQGMQDILYLAGPNAEVAERVRAAVEANRSSYSMRRALEGEIMLETGFMNECRQLGPQSLFLLSRDKSRAEAKRLAAPFERTRVGRRVWKLLADAGEAALIGKMRNALAIVQRPYQERRRLAKRWIDSIEDRSMGTVGVFGAALLPVWGISDEKAMAIRAQEEEVMASAEALAYKAQHGEWPARLEQIQRYPSIDPFTGRPLKYHRLPDGFVIYSLGESGRDDGGQDPRPGTPARDWKAVFRYPAPPRRPYPTSTPLPVQKPS